MQTTPVPPARADACTEATQHPTALLLAALTAIVQETMAYSPIKPSGGDSYLPPALVDQAQRALAEFGARVVPYNEAVATALAGAA